MRLERVTGEVSCLLEVCVDNMRQLDEACHVELIEAQPRSGSLGCWEEEDGIM